MQLRIVVVGLLLATALALGLIAYQIANPQRNVAPTSEIAAPPPPVATVSYLVAARALAPGMLERDSDLVGSVVPAEQFPKGAILNDEAGRLSLHGALILHFIEPGAPVTLADVLRPRDRGFLAAVLDPDTRAVTIGVDPITGVGGLIWPGDHVDVILTQEVTAAYGGTSKRVVGETVLSDLRVIAVDQDIVQGAPANSNVVGRLATTVTLQATSDEAERIAVATRLGHLSLAIRSINGTSTQTALKSNRAPVSGEDVSTALATANTPSPSSARMQVIQGDQRSEVMFK